MSTAQVRTAPASLDRRWIGVLLGGLVAGLIDITYACVMSWFRAGKSPLWVLQSVASGLLGMKAFDGGLPTGLLGLVCHFVIALGAATVYFLASKRLALLRDRPVVSGLIFGVCVWLFMNFVVLPLSAYPFFSLPYPPMAWVRGFLSHGIGVGLPIALLLRRYSPRGAA
ncbi:MAG TPA: hypothetical protein VN783_12355 [Thermoanaerobaculia bacterium]|nr:hypothetical protein [Thermoanaerobaculia bacterium]